MTGISYRATRALNSALIEPLSLVLCWPDGPQGTKVARLRTLPSVQTRTWSNTVATQSSCEAIRLKPWVDGILPNNAAMQVAANALIELARLSGGCALALHHTGKGGAGEVSQRVSRGGSSLTCAARSIVLMQPMPDENASKLAVAEGLAGRFVELHTVKNNYGPLGGEPVVLQRNERGVLTQRDLQKEFVPRAARELVAILKDQERRLTRDELLRRKEGKPVREALGAALDATVKNRDLERAIDFAFKPSEGFALLEERECEGARGRKRKELVPLNNERKT